MKDSITKLLCIGLSLSSVFIGLHLHADYLEKTIWLPDSFGGVYSPSVLEYNSQNNRIYVVGLNNRISVVDGLTYKRSGGLTVGEGTHCLSYNSLSNIIYCSNGDFSTVSAFCGETDSFIRTIPVGNFPRGLQYNPISNKLYCANYDDNTVSIISGEDNQVIKTLTGFNCPRWLCFNPINNKVYCANFGANTISVISGVNDTVIAEIDLSPYGGPSSRMIYDSVHNEICSGNYYGTIAIISGDNDNIIDTIGLELSWGYFHDMTLDYKDNKLYSVHSYDGVISIVSTETHALLKIDSLPTQHSSIEYDPVDNKVFVASDNYGCGILYTIDAINDSVVSQDTMGTGLGSLLYVKPQNELYSPDHVYDMVSIFDCSEIPLVKRTRVGAIPKAFCYNSLDDKLYCAASDTNLHVISCAENYIVNTIRIPHNPRLLCYNSVNDKVYCVCDWRTFVIVDGHNDTILDTLKMGNVPKDIMYNSIDNKVYYLVDMPDTGVVFIIDGNGDSLIAVDTVGQDVWGLVLNTANDKIYCGSWSGNVAIIDGKGDSVITTVKVADFGVTKFTYNKAYNKVYCTTGQNELKILNGANDSILGSIPARGTCWALCYNETENKLYAGMGSGWIYIINGTTDSILTHLECSDGPSRLLYYKKYNKIYGSHHPGNFVSVISGSEDLLIASIPVGQRPRDLSVSPINDQLYCANSDNSNISVIKCTPQGIQERDWSVQDNVTLTNSYPNPFGKATTIRYVLPTKTLVSLRIYDLSGRLLETLVEEKKESGNHKISWEPKGLTTGIYFVELDAANYKATEKLIFLK